MAGKGLELTGVHFNDKAKVVIVRRPKQAKGFVVVAKRWLMESTDPCLRAAAIVPAKDRGNTLLASKAWILIAALRRTTSHIANALKTQQEF